MIDLASTLIVWVIVYLMIAGFFVVRQITFGRETEQDEASYNRLALTWLVGAAIIYALKWIRAPAPLAAVLLVACVVVGLWPYLRLRRVRMHMGADSKRAGLRVMFLSAALLVIMIGAHDAIADIIPFTPHTPFDAPEYQLRDFFEDRWPHVLVMLLGLWGGYLYVRSR